jgi:hypothetical protein
MLETTHRGRNLQVPPYASPPSPKSERRNPKEIRSPKPEKLLASGAVSPLFQPFLRTSDFGLPSGFGPRISDSWGDGAVVTDRMRPLAAVLPLDVPLQVNRGQVAPESNI